MLDFLGNISYLGHGKWHPGQSLTRQSHRSSPFCQDRNIFSCLTWTFLWKLIPELSILSHRRYCLCVLFCYSLHRQYPHGYLCKLSLLTLSLLCVPLLDQSLTTRGCFRHAFLWSFWVPYLFCSSFSSLTHHRCLCWASLVHCSHCQHRFHWSES